MSFAQRPDVFSFDSSPYEKSTSGAEAPISVRNSYVGVKTATYKDSAIKTNRAQDMIYQLTWKFLPGLRGLSCSDFRATPTAAPNTEQGVAIDCPSERDCNALLQELK